MIVVGIKTWEQEEYLQDAVLSAINIADEIIIAFGQKNGPTTHDPKETTLLINKLITKNPGKIAVIRGRWQTGAEAMNAMWQLATEGSYFIRLEGNELIPNTFADEFEDRLIDIAESSLPLYAQTLYFYKDTEHTIHSPKLDTPQCRGFMVDHRWIFTTPESIPFPTTKRIQMKTPILSYKYLNYKNEFDNGKIKPYK